MLSSPLALTRHLWLLRGRKLRLPGALACALLLAAVTAGCGSMSRTSTATPTATPAPPPPAPAGVYVLTPHAMDVLSLADGTVQHVFPYENPAADVQGYQVTPLAIADGAAYFVTNGALSNTETVSVPSTVVALQATDGSVLWRFSLPNTLTPNPNVPSRAFLSSVVNGIIYVVSYAYASPTIFYAISTKDGHVLWQVQSDTIRGSATVADGVVYLPVQPQDGTQHLLALRATDGTQLWDLQVPKCADLESPVVDNGMVFVNCVFNPSGVYGVRASDGTLVWHQGSLGFLPGPLVAANGLVYASAGGCGPVYYPPCPPIYFYALDEQTGAVRWRNSGAVEFVTVTADALYYYLCDIPYRPCDTLTVLDPSTGAVRMRYPPPNIHIQRRETQDTVAGGVQYFEGDEQIFAISLATDALLWHSPTLVEQSNPTIAIFVVPQAS